MSWKIRFSRVSDFFEQLPTVLLNVTCFCGSHFVHGSLMLLIRTLWYGCCLIRFILARWKANNQWWLQKHPIVFTLYDSHNISSRKGRTFFRYVRNNVHLLAMVYIYYHLLIICQSASHDGLGWLCSWQWQSSRSQENLQVLLSLANNGFLDTRLF